MGQYSNRKSFNSQRTRHRVEKPSWQNQAPESYDDFLKNLPQQSEWQGEPSKAIGGHNTSERTVATPSVVTSASIVDRSFSKDYTRQARHKARSSRSPSSTSVQTTFRDAEAKAFTEKADQTTSAWKSPSPWTSRSTRKPSGLVWRRKDINTSTPSSNLTLEINATSQASESSPSSGISPSTSQTHRSVIQWIGTTDPTRVSSSGAAGTYRSFTSHGKYLGNISSTTNTSPMTPCTFKAK